MSWLLCRCCVSCHATSYAHTFTCTVRIILQSSPYTTSSSQSRRSSHSGRQYNVVKDKYSQVSALVISSCFHPHAFFKLPFQAVAHASRRSNSTASAPAVQLTSMHSQQHRHSSSMPNRDPRNLTEAEFIK